MFFTQCDACHSAEETDHFCAEHFFCDDCYDKIRAERDRMYAEFERTIDERAMRAVFPEIEG